jgi:hypothetical protein
MRRHRDLDAPGSVPGQRLSVGVIARYLSSAEGRAEVRAHGPATPRLSPGVFEHMDRRALLLALGALAFPVAAKAEDEVFLLFVTQPGCPYCARWERQIGPIYPNSPEARRAPLRQVDRQDATIGMLELAAPVVFTPTFILISGDREVGRITGYVDDAFFWGQLKRLVERLPAARS